MGQGEHRVTRRYDVVILLACYQLSYVFYSIWGRKRCENKTRRANKKRYIKCIDVSCYEKYEVLVDDGQLK